MTRFLSRPGSPSSEEPRTDPPNVDVRNRIPLRTARRLAGLGALAFPAFGWLSGLSGIHDPPAFRAPIAVAAFAVWIGIRRSTWVQAHIRTLFLALIYAITTHVAFLLVMNDLHPRLALGSLIVMLGFVATTTYTVTTQKSLSLYLVYACASLVTAAFLVEEPQTDRTHFVASIATMTALGFVAGTSQLSMIARLLDGERRLRHDVERRIRIEAALRESEAQTRALLEAIPDVLLRVDETGTIIELWNEDRHVLGATIRELRGRHLAGLAGDQADQRAAIEHALGFALEREEVASATCDIVHPEGLRKAEIRIVSSGAEHALVLVRDVTQEHAVESRIRLADRLVALGTLASGVAHEVNNPLSYVLGNVAFTIEELATKAEIEPQVVQALREAHDGGLRIRDIVAGLRQYTSSIEDDRRSVDVHHTIESSLRMLGNQIRHHARIVADLAEVPPVEAHPTRLLQVLLNLVTNALHAFTNGPSSRNVIRIATRLTSEGLVEIAVEDNGIGIAEEDLGRIFDPFFTTKGASAGTGLGLYLSRQFITSCGGSIDVRSRPGEGTTFFVQLRPAAPEVVTATHVPLRAADRCRILIVDDDTLVARSTARMLAEHEVQVAANVEDALQLCRFKTFDLILCDVMMPGADGPEFYAELVRARSELASRVVFMTGGAFTERATHFLASVSNPCIEKPFDRRRVEQLLATTGDLEQAS